MLTMIIADDESLARKSLELFIKKEFPEIEVVATPEDGIELIRAVEQYQPDMAIVDINMPGFTGIRAIDILRTKGIRTRFVINTAYGEFEYVKKALDLKVDGYLLKPGTYEESVKTIRTLCGIVERDRLEQMKQNQMQSILHTVSPVLEKEILLSLCTNRPASEDFKAYCNVNNLVFQRGCIVNFLGGGLICNKKELRSVIHEVLCRICDYLITITDHNIMVMLLVPEQITEAEQDVWAFDVMALVVDRLKKVNGVVYQLGMGGIYGSFEKMRHSYQESMEVLQQNAGEKSSVWEKNSNLYVERAEAYIEKHFKEDLSLERVAESIKISSFYLSRLMKSCLGVKFIEYLTTIRMQEAMRLARETMLPIKEIAERCGYSNITYFCKVFKKQTGKTIGEFRKDL